MEKEGKYIIENTYLGGYSSLDPNKAYSTSFTGYRINARELGAPTKPDTANQIQQVSQLLNQGIVPIETGALGTDVFNQIPKQHFKEIDRLAKLTGAKISLHAPIVEPSGMGEQGWSELQRQAAERQLNDVVEKAYELSSKESVPITIHSTGGAGSEFVPDKEKGKKISRLIAVERDTGRPAGVLEEETLYYPHMDLEKGKRESPEGRLNALNSTRWEESINQQFFNKERADEIIRENSVQIQHLWNDLRERKVNQENLTPTQQIVYRHLVNAKTYLDDIQQNVGALFNKAWKNTEGDEESREVLKDVSERYKKNILSDSTPMGQSNAIQNLMDGLRAVQPKNIVSVEEFALDKSSQTFANVAFNAYQKFGGKGNIPKINIENLPSGMGFSSLGDMNKLIVESKNKFAERLIEEKGMNENDAKRKADEVIGMTLDVGHLNIAKKQGFTDKDLLKEVEEIAKHVKHVHLTDNFGFSDSHLPPGMGNVPMKEILERLEKAGFKGNKIVEAAGLVQHFQQSPYVPSLEAFGSSMYSGGGPGPSWNQALGLEQGYSSGYGMMLPSNNYQTFGAGFSQLPQELGGEVPRAGGRFSQRGME
jgi:sugar phosphate isomerase/epimerase